MAYDNSSMSEQERELKKQEAKSENDIKALQSVGQVLISYFLLLFAEINFSSFSKLIFKNILLKFEYSWEFSIFSSVFNFHLIIMMIHSGS